MDLKLFYFDVAKNFTVDIKLGIAECWPEIQRLDSYPPGRWCNLNKSNSVIVDRIIHGKSIINLDVLNNS